MSVIDRALSGDRVALARVLSFVEGRGAELRKIIENVYSKTGNAFVFGITGPPGAGKSTVTDRLVAEIRKAKKKVAVLAIDPSSPFSGGAILGDRIRMQSHTADQDVYIRSIGTRGKRGGLSHSTKDAVTVLDAAGFDWIIVETAGVGQTELDVLKVAHAVCVVLVPESGDSIQVMKAGLMEIADLFVVNKSDRPEADKLVRELVTMIGLSDDHDPTKWKVPVIKTQALFEVGVDELFRKSDEFRSFQTSTGEFERRRRRFLEEEVSEIVIDEVRKNIELFLSDNAGKLVLQELIDRKISPIEASDTVKKHISSN